MKFNYPSSKEVVDAVFELFTKEEVESLTNKTFINVYQTLVGLTEDLVPVHSTIEESKKAIKEIINFLRGKNEFLDSDGSWNFAFESYLRNVLFLQKKRTD